MKNPGNVSSCNNDFKASKKMMERLVSEKKIQEDKFKVGKSKVGPIYALFCDKFYRRWFFESTIYLQRYGTNFLMAHISGKIPQDLGIKNYETHCIYVLFMLTQPICTL